MAVSVSPGIVRAISEKVGVACLLAALVLLACGATGQIPFWGPVKDWLFQVVLLALGAVLLIPSVFLLWGELGAKRSVEPQAPRRVIEQDIKKLGFDIDTPDSDTVTAPVVFTGILKRPVADGCKIWLVNHGETAGRANFWPSEAIDVSAAKNRKELRWTANYRPKLTNPTERRVLQFYLVGPDGQAFIAMFKRVNAEFFSRNIRWEGLTDLPADMVPIGKPIKLMVSRSAAEGVDAPPRGAATP